MKLSYRNEFIRDLPMNSTEQQFFNDLEKKLWTAADKLNRSSFPDLRGRMPKHSPVKQ
jgi:hypothetical protein